MVYMSRALIPKDKNLNKNKIFKQVCIYGFNIKELKEFSSLKKGSLEKIEDIEL